MVVGFNHNVRYKGDVFHVQTEDSGINNPHIITLLYRGGTILSSRKTSYADILKIDNLEKVVEDLMKEQHKDMLRRLKAGEFDARAFPSKDANGTMPVEPEPAVAPGTPPPESPKKAEIVTSEGEKGPSLDEVILDYLITDHK
jgi:hypothetical protein